MDGVCANIQSLLEEIVKWCPTIHPDKTEVMLLTRINFIGPLRPIKLGDNVIILLATPTACMGFIDWDKFQESLLF